MYLFCKSGEVMSIAVDDVDVADVEDLLFCNCDWFCELVLDSVLEPVT